MNINEKVNELKNEMIEDTREILKIRSVEDKPEEGMPFGAGVNEALNKALNIAEKLGFKTVNLDGYVGYAEYGSGEEYITALGHLDVVPEGDGWIYPPYAAEIHKHRIYARGAVDDKGPIIAALYGLKAIKELKLPISKKIRIIFGCNEETGSKDIKYYNTKEKPPVAGFTPDAEYPIIYAEKGTLGFNFKNNLKQCTGDIIVRSIKGGVRPNMVPDNCKAVINAKDKGKLVEYAKNFSQNHNYEIEAVIVEDYVMLNTNGISAHGSLPHLGKNAIMQMLQFLGEIPIIQEELLEYIKFLNKFINFETDGTSLGVGFQDEASGKLSLNAGVINMNESNISLSIDIRYPVTIERNKIDDIIMKKAEESHIELENVRGHEPLYFPPHHPVILKLQKVYKEQTGKEATLLAIGGGTYAKSMNNIVAFGPVFPGGPDLAHQANEYIEIEDLILSCKIYANALYELAK